MSAYYQQNKEKWNERRRKNREAINEAKRKAYAEDPNVQQYYKDQAKLYRQQNPNRRRHTELKARYGLTAEQYEAMLVAQGNACAICSKEFTKTPNVDHCHKSGQVRGLLCFNCNRAVGHFQDDVQIMASAMAYLQRTK